MKQKINYERLGEKIKGIRLSRGYTLDVLAEKVGCSIASISNVENSHTKVSLGMLVAIANALETTLDYLLDSEYINKPADIDKKFLELPMDIKEDLVKVADILINGNYVNNN